MREILLKIDSWVEAPEVEAKKMARIITLAVVSLLLVVGVVLGNIAFVGTFPAAGIVINLLALIAFMSWLLKD